MITLVLSMILAYIFSVLLVPIAIRYALSHHIVDVPDDKIKRHEKPVPYLGGVAIFIAFILTLLIVVFFRPYILDKNNLLLVVSLGLIMILGLYDDLKNLKPIIKIIVEIIAITLLVKGGFRITIKDLPSWFNIFLTYFWYIGIINALNIIDIMDGLASGVSLIASVVFLFLALQTGKIEMAFFSTVLIGLTSGFLRYNFFPARIYLGDAGSLFLGTLLGVLAVTGSYTELNHIGLFTPVLILGVPVYDTFYVMGMRWFTGKPVLKGSNDHIALRISATGLGRKNTVIFLYLISMILGMISLTIVSVKLELALVIYILVAITIVMATLKLSTINMDGK